tara:strand:+ start:558 stop:1589 length:1032 start_codon:yes stop_codon:yes gene_type:complete
MGRKNNKFDGEFVIRNFALDELSNQKGSTVDQLPFSIGVGLSDRSRGVAYFASESDKPETFVPDEPLQTTSLTQPIIYFDFQEGSGTTLTNKGTSGSVADGTLATFGGGSADFRWVTTGMDNVLSGTAAIEFFDSFSSPQTSSDGYAFVDRTQFVPNFGDSGSIGGNPAVGNSWSVSMWYKATGSAVIPLWYVGLANTLENTSVGLYVNADNTLILYGDNISGGSRATTNAYDDIRDGEFHHVVATYDGSATLGNKTKIYVDGVSSMDTDTLDVGCFGVNDDSFVIGRGGHVGSFVHLSGAVQEFAYYDIVLSEGNVNELKQNISTRTGDLRGAIKFTDIFFD